MAAIRLLARDGLAMFRSLKVFNYRPWGVGWRQRTWGNAIGLRRNQGLEFAFDL